VNYLDAILIGITEGLTEFIPVSSTGHIILVQRLLDLPSTVSSNAYAICIQAGAILAVLTLYRARIRQMIMGLVGRDAAGRQLVINLIAAFAPAVVVGLLFDDIIEKYLFGLWPIIAAWVMGGFVILAVNQHPRLSVHTKGQGLEKLKVRQAVMIGAVQCIAMWPGVSRSLATLLGGVFVGLSLPAAIEFSFLLGLVTLSAASIYKGIQHGHEMITTYDPMVLLLGLVSAWISAMAAMRWMVGYLESHSLKIFAWWRFGVAAVAAFWILSV
jgi:undecaprenyl-diphosphatase